MIFTTVVMVVLVASLITSMCWLDSGITWHKRFCWWVKYLGVLCIRFYVDMWNRLYFRLANREADKRIFVKTILLFHKKQVGIGALIYAP